MPYRNAAEKSSLRIPTTVWMLGFVSLLMDVSSEMIHAVLPLFMAGTLGAGAAVIGLVEGAGEAAAMISKVFSGVLADRFGKRKLLVFLGYFLGVISKPVFALAGAVPVVFAARFFDRIGKGISGAPRDAIVASVTPKALWGSAYGLRQSLDAAGAFSGPAISSALLFFLALDFQTVFWIALIPGVLCLLLIIFGVEDNAQASVRTKPAPMSFRELLALENPLLRQVMLLAAIFHESKMAPARESPCNRCCILPELNVRPQHQQSDVHESTGVIAPVSLSTSTPAVSTS